MPIVRDIAVVLRHYPFSETSQVVVVYGRAHGQVRLIAKGVKRSTRKRFAPAIDLLEEGHVAFSPRKETAESLSILTEWKQARSFGGLRERLDRLHAAQYVAEITAMLTVEFDPNVGLYDALSDALSRLCDAHGVLAILVDYQWRMLDSVGLSPRLDACVLCDRTAPLTHFSSFEGGMVCRSCEGGQVEKRGVPPGVLALLRSCESADPPSAAVHVPSKPDVERIASTPAATNARREAFELLNYHVSHSAGREPLCASSILNGLTPKLGV